MLLSSVLRAAWLCHEVHRKINDEGPEARRQSTSPELFLLCVLQVFSFNAWKTQSAARACKSANLDDIFLRNPPSSRTCLSDSCLTARRGGATSILTLAFLVRLWLPHPRLIPQRESWRPTLALQKLNWQNGKLRPSKMPVSWR